MTNTHNLPLVSVVLPAFNESVIIEENLRILYTHLATLSEKFDFELIIINDGSTDDTGEIADRFALLHHNVQVYHHLHNFRLGQALRTGFERCNGDYIVVLDIDLSYAPDHVERLVDKLIETGAEVVVASPYMKGGQVSNVPWLRKQFSYWANKFLSLTATKDHLSNISTLTGMVRGYDAEFLLSINLRAMDVDINTEILYKAMILRARIIEIPAHLAWEKQIGPEPKRKSSLQVLKAIIHSLVSGFTFRPFMFLILPGFLLFLLSLYPLCWLLFHTLRDFFSNQGIAPVYCWERFFNVISQSLSCSPIAFIFGGFNLMISIQLMSLGILALQKKKYFEELFHVTNVINAKYNAIIKDKGRKYYSSVNRCKK
jgi:glycosyltransferase involved in cell wall biosynthesis